MNSVKIQKKRGDTMKARLIRGEMRSDAEIHVERKTNFRKSDLHGHDFYELDIIAAGDADTTVNGKPTRATAYTVFFMTPEDFHAYPTGESLDILNVQFYGGAVSDEILLPLIDAGKRVFKLEKDTFAILTQAFALMESAKEEEILCRLLEVILL